ncbi:hypothetical protein [Chitinophaga sp. CF418]|uniref:hypothetical protein n=1 Tax=Chitinophaga sp. CF418 TaxID=1855287 RepID=UPI000910EFBB|nr:hypothetical protein [Chitinophaga sp. CF418]SHN45502.1 hypothetical protein SAMN05216311_12079 [Chitinophaga sp. CF418]
MKKVIFTAIAFVALAGGAFALKGKPVTQKGVNEYTYYKHGECDVPIVCSDEGTGALCSEFYSGTTLYYQPGCNVAQTVAIPLGRLPN